MRADLHLHTSASDGLLNPAQLMALLDERRIDLCAVTDHDTMNGVEAARRAAEALGIRLIDGVELSAAERVEVHILGYFPSRPQEIIEALDHLRQMRVSRMHQMLGRLQRLGLAIEPEQVEVEPGTAPGRMHLARALVNAGHAQSVSEAFHRYLMPGRPGYAPREKMSYRQAIQLIHKGGGLAVVAHPGIIQADRHTLPGRIRSLKDQGLDGVEVFHPRHTPAQRQLLGQLAHSMDLLVTGGSDCHGLPGVSMPGDTLEHWTQMEEDCAGLMDRMSVGRPKKPASGL